MPSCDYLNLAIMYTCSALRAGLVGVFAFDARGVRRAHIAGLLGAGFCTHRIALSPVGIVGCGGRALRTATCDTTMLHAPAFDYRKIDRATDGNVKGYKTITEFVRDMMCSISPPHYTVSNFEKSVVCTLGFLVLVNAE